jgi:hypothetical protein
MGSSTDRLKILKMVQDGKITAEEGIELLEMLGDKAGKGKAETPPEPPKNPTPQWFRVLVTDTVTGKTRVNVRLPVNLVKAGMKMGARFSPQVEGMDASQFTALIESGAIGKVIDVYDDDDGEHVEVYIE